MSFTKEEIAEFEAEAIDLFDGAEKSLLAIDRGEPFTDHYDAVFRTFHSIKGAAGMMEMAALQSHMHHLETIFISQKETKSPGRAYLELFLKGLDAARAILAGQSVKFDFSVPPPTPAAAPARSPTPLAEPEVLGRVIVVDDEPELVETLSSILVDVGFEVRGFTEPARALEVLKEFKPDLVMTDLMMPGMTGMQLLERLKKTAPDLPVIFVSGHVSKDFLIEAIGLGVFGVIEKPFDVKQIVASCRQAVARHRTAALLNQSINLIMYQFSDLSDFLKAQGKIDVRNVISGEINALLEQRRRLRQSN